jgi:hypothetical protein
MHAPPSLDSYWIKEGNHLPNGQPMKIRDRSRGKLSASAEFYQPEVYRASDKPSAKALDNCYKIVFEGKECRYYDDYANSTWKYYVEELPCAQDLSNWVLELPDCVKAITATPEPWERVHPDPNAHLDGIKWQTGGGFEAGIFTVKLRGCPPVKGTQVAAKGPDVDWGFIKGPGCSYK